MTKISVNNEAIEINAGTLLSDALVLWNYSEGKMAVAINGEFVSRSHYSTRELQAGDTVDIVKPVGGG